MDGKQIGEELKDRCSLTQVLENSCLNMYIYLKFFNSLVIAYMDIMYLHHTHTLFSHHFCPNFLSHSPYFTPSFSFTLFSSLITHWVHVIPPAPACVSCFIGAWATYHWTTLLKETNFPCQLSAPSGSLDGVGPHNVWLDLMQVLCQQP